MQTLLHCNLQQYEGYFKLILNVGDDNLVPIYEFERISTFGLDKFACLIHNFWRYRKMHRGVRLFVKQDMIQKYKFLERKFIVRLGESGNHITLMIKEPEKIAKKHIELNVSFPSTGGPIYIFSSTYGKSVDIFELIKMYNTEYLYDDFVGFAEYRESDLVDYITKKTIKTETEVATISNNIEYDD